MELIEPKKAIETHTVRLDSELGSCPFCGANRATTWTELRPALTGPASYVAHVECGHCNARGPSSMARPVTGEGHNWATAEAQANWIARSPDSTPPTSPD